jgi:heterodisulfide reductase subunit A
MLTFKVGTLARQLCVHRNTITNWIKKGKFPAKSTAAKRYTITKKGFIRFCEKEDIPHDVVMSIIEGSREETHGTKAASLSGPEGMARLVKEEPPARDIFTKKSSPVSRVVGAAMVVGGGIGGIQAALDLVHGGYFVYLIEKTAGIGGTMAQLDKIFPTNDCASCLLLPGQVKCGGHQNVQLITLAEVQSVQGQAGDFAISIKKYPRYIDTEKCIACGMCVEKCPISVPDPFNCHIRKRKAVYIKYDQSVPQKYAIDDASCLYFTHGKCRACEKFCPTGAVDFDQVEETVTLHVGAVVLAPGFKPFDPSPHGTYGYGEIKDVVTSLEYERLLAVNGPCQGNLVRPSDRTNPRKIAWLQCVGSRNQNNCGNSYCSSICCMVAVKQALVSQEIFQDHRVDRTIFFLDLRSHGKESERFFERAKNDNVRFVRAFPHTMEPGAYGSGVAMRFIDEEGVMHHETFDMAVLSIGFESPRDVMSLARIFDIELDEHQFAATSCFKPLESSTKGVYAIGAFQTPKSIARSVTQASAAAAAVATLLMEARDSLTNSAVYPMERNISGEIPMVGVFICSCGNNIAGVVDVEAVADYAAHLPHVVCVENNLFSCSVDAQKGIKKKIEKFKLNRIVIASCTPRTHEPLFQTTLKSAGLNGFMLEVANIRNHNAWVHKNQKDAATRKAKDQVRMAVARVIHHYPLLPERKQVVQRVLVVGGGMVGMTCALTLAHLGVQTILIERWAHLGGNALSLGTCSKDQPVSSMLEELIVGVLNHPNVRIYRNATLVSVSGSVGDFHGDICVDGKKEKIDFGAAVMAVGAKEAVPREYLYGKVPRVMTQLEFGHRVLADLTTVRRARNIVFIQCVGSREPKRPYCSRVCCIHSVKVAIHLKKININIKVYVLYRDMRTYGEWEAYYTEARELGVMFIRYEVDQKPLVTQTGENITVLLSDPILRRPVKINADYLVLASGVVAHGNKNPADLFKFDVNPDGFFNGAHPKLRPVDLSVAGLFLAGLCNYPKPMDESIEEAQAAAYRAFALLSQREIVSEAVKAFVTKHCHECGLCVDVCPFNAISMGRSTTSKIPSLASAHSSTQNVEADGEKNSLFFNSPGTDQGMSEYAMDGRVIIDAALCQGCGICAATCPNQGVMVHGFTQKQLQAQILSVFHDPIKGNGGEGSCFSCEKGASSPFEPVIIGFLCNWCSYAGADLAGVARLQYPAGFRPIRVMCSGMIHPNYIMEAFAQGADGVMVMGCHPGECHYLQGNEKAAARAGVLSIVLPGHGIDPRRFELHWISSAEAAIFANMVTAFTLKLKALGPQEQPDEKLPPDSSHG